jgi:hypothetical protein
VVIDPPDSSIVGRRATRQLIASATYPDGTQRDLTRLLEWTSESPEVAVVDAHGHVVPKGDGTAIIVARNGSVEARTTVQVQKFQEPAPISFRHDVIPALSQAGCNMGACHGTPTGKGGFRLSLRGYLPDQDFTTLSRDAAGRRIGSTRLPRIRAWSSASRSANCPTKGACDWSEARPSTTSCATGSPKGRRTTPASSPP